MIGVSEEELYNLPTAEYVHRRGGFVIRQLTVYHVAFHAFADLRNVEVDFTVHLIRSHKEADCLVYELLFFILICFVE